MCTETMVCRMFASCSQKIDLPWALSKMYKNHAA